MSDQGGQSRSGEITALLGEMMNRAVVLLVILCAIPVSSALCGDDLEAAVEQMSQTPQSPGDEVSLRKFLESYVGTSPSSVESRYRFAFVDLRDDGTQEAIVYITDSDWCGSGGCTTLILAPSGSTFELVTKITIARLPIRILETKTNGWHDISVVVAGGGILSAYDAKLSFDGSTYPTNPTVPPAKKLLDAAAGTVAIAPPPSRRPPSAQGPVAAIEQVLLIQQAAWNRHDLDAFMTGYWNSPQLTFFSGGKENHGWQATLDRYKATYASPGHEMGTLEFSELRIEMLGPESAFVRGAWHLTMPNGKTPHGLFTLIFRKFPEGWKIVHDHTSVAE